MQMDNRMERFLSRVAILSGRPSHYKAAWLHYGKVFAYDLGRRYRVRSRRRHQRCKVIWIYKFQHFLSLENDFGNEGGLLAHPSVYEHMKSVLLLHADTIQVHVLLRFDLMVEIDGQGADRAL